MTPRNALVVAAAALLACLGTAAPARAAEPQPGPSALSTHLTYDPVQWTAGGTAMTVMAPRGWSLVITPDGQGRFNAPDRADVLAMGDRGEGSVRHELRDKVAALQGTPGLLVLESHAHGGGDSASGELRYRWTPPGGAPRLVDYRYQGDDVYEVAGRLIDSPGLAAVLDMATSSGSCS